MPEPVGLAEAEGLVEAPRDCTAVVRIWQANIGQGIVARVPVKDGQVVEPEQFTNVLVETMARATAPKELIALGAPDRHRP